MALKKKKPKAAPPPQGFHTGGSVQRRRPGAPKGNPGVDIGDSGGMSRDGGGAATFCVTNWIGVCCHCAPNKLL